MIDYLDYHKSSIFVSSKEGTYFDGLSFKTTRNTYHPFHFHDGVEILYVHRGAILVHAFNEVETVKEGQFLANDPYVVHSVESITADTVITCINISDDYSDENDGLISSVIQKVSETQEYARLKNDILEWIMMYSRPETTMDKLLWQMKKIFPSLQQFMSVALLYRNEEGISAEESEKDHERLTSIINYLFHHHDEAISLDSISSDLYISKYYLSHFVKKAFGHTLKQTLSNIRCEESTIDLLGSQMTIEEIATKHGFPSVRSFNDVFPRYTGVSPTEYRRRHQKDTVLYQDFIGEEVGVDHLSSEDAGTGAIHSNQGCCVSINLPKGSYEVLCVETRDTNVSNRTVKLNKKNTNISIDSNSDELILRIKKQ